MKRVLAVVGTAAAICAAAPAHAGSGVSAPTVAVSTSAQGHVLPVAAMRGQWTVDKPGRQATLNVQGPVASGTVTTVRSTWTSSWRWTHRRKIALDASVQNDFQDVAGTAAKNRVVTLIQVHARGHRWQSLTRFIARHDSVFLAPSGFGVGVGVGTYDRALLQWRVVMTATFTDTSTEGLTETVRLR